MKISIITVCYNAADTLGDTLDSVISQSYSKIEHIIVDGGSVDGTEKIVNEKGQRVAIWRSEPDLGVYDGMNKGLLLASNSGLNSPKVTGTDCPIISPSALG